MEVFSVYMNWVEIIFNGVKFGVVLAFLVGPVFFAIIQTSIERGFWNGVLVALGVSVSDTLIVIICYFGVAQFTTDSTVKSYMAYVGGGILILFGVYYLFIKSRKSKQSDIHTVEERKLYRYIVKGFVLNGFTPTVLLFWLGTISIASLDFGYVKGFEFFLFFGSLLVTVLSTDIVKAYLADKLRTLVTQRLLMIMNILLGIAMIAFGVRLILLSTL